MAKTAHVILDTSVLLRCRPLRELPWQDLQYGDLVSPDEIRVVVPRPTLIELQAKRYLRQTMKRAERVLDELRHKPTTLRPGSPTVSVCSTRDPLPSPEAMKAVGLDPGFGLTPGWSDDYLIMFAQTHAESHENVVLLTADGPLSERADEHPGVTSIHLSQADYGDWFQAPKPDAEVVQLRQRVAALEADFEVHVPVVRISFGTDSGELTAVHVGSLTADEWSAQRQRLEAALPQVTDFEFVDVGAARLLAGGLLGDPQLVSATLKERSKYKSDYAEWLSACESETALHRRVMECVRFVVCIENIGTAHARTVEVNLDALGCQIMDASDESLDPPGLDEMASYLSPPEPPPTAPDLFKERFAYRSSDLLLSPDLDVSIARPFRDGPPGQFEYTTDKPSFEERLTLRCPLWPHGGEPVKIPLWIRWNRGAVGTKNQVRCAVSVRVGAENIVEPVHTKLPMKIAIRHESGIEHARRMVDAIIKHHTRK